MPMHKLMLFACLCLAANISYGQSNSKPCSPYRVDQSCKPVKQSPFRVDVKRPESKAPTYIRSTTPTGQIDFAGPQWKIVGDKIYQLGSTGMVDFSKPSYKMFNGNYYQLSPSGQVDFSKPSFTIE